MDSFNTKTNLIKEHLLDKGTITSWEAIQKYHATRLSAIIFNLRKRGFVINNDWNINIDKQGRKSRYVTYRLEKVNEK